jgi:Tfp pilus assembly protein PilZ
LTDLSASGARVHLADALPVGTAVLLRIAIPGEVGSIEARGRVSWCEQPEPAEDARFREAGVRFEVVGEEARRVLHRFLRAHAGPTESLS